MSKNFSEKKYAEFFADKPSRKKTEQEKISTRTQLEFTLEGTNMPTINTDDISEIVGRASYYFERCASEGIKPGLAGLCVWIGCSRNQWLKWVNGVEKRSTHQSACMKIQGILEANLESEIAEGTINPVSGFFLLKNNHGYTDNTPSQTDAKKSIIEERGLGDILKLVQDNEKTAN